MEVSRLRAANNLNQRRRAEGAGFKPLDLDLSPIAQAARQALTTEPMTSEAAPAPEIAIPDPRRGREMSVKDEALIALAERILLKIPQGLGTV